MMYYFYGKMPYYNFSSTDPEHFNRIRVIAPNHVLTQYVNICVTTFTSNCNIEVMNETDYIEFMIDRQTVKVYMQSHSKLNAAALPSILEECLAKENVPISVTLTNTDTIIFFSDLPFNITDMSYNMRLITGFYCVPVEDFPLMSESFTVQESEQENGESTTDVEKYRICAKSVGYMLSTPILYLLTNVGNHVYYNRMESQNKIQSGTVCMCLNNSFSPSFPIIAQQGDIITKCPIGVTSALEFILVDANMQEIKLLNPMYITVRIMPAEEEPLPPGILYRGISSIDIAKYQEIMQQQGIQVPQNSVDVGGSQEEKQ